MNKRHLEPGHSVVIIYHQELGFISDPATCTGYRVVSIGEKDFNIPFFTAKWWKTEFSGLECFWLLEKEGTPELVEKFQKEIIRIQTDLLVLSGNPIQKFKDKEVKKMAEEKFDKLQHLINKLGFDPRDDSWIEVMAESVRERHWFKFEREEGFITDWKNIADKFNIRYNDRATASDCKTLSKKRMRYLMGAYHLRMQGNPDQTEWRRSAKAFEQKHQDREKRMNEWSLAHQNKFPLVKTKKPIDFYYGPWYSQLLENLPDYFTSTDLAQVIAGTTLRVVSYDPQDKYVRLDFLPEIVKLVKGKDITTWDKEEGDYEFIVHPTSLEQDLEFLSPLE